MENKLSNSDWMFILQLIYRLNRIDDFTAFCLTFLEQIRLLIPHTEGGVYRMKRKVGEHYPFLRICSSSSNHNFVNDFEISDTDCFWAEYLYSPWSVVFRHSDIDAAVDFEKTELYQRVFVPQNIHYAIKAILIHEDRLCGVISMFRPKTDNDFSNRDVFILNVLKDHLALRFSQLLAKAGLRTSLDAKQATHQEITAKYNLTNREDEILSIILKGDESEEEICKKLFISLSTLKKHISNIYAKTNVKNRMQLRRLAKVL